ncbi:MAG: DUF3868 domain-containing protein [Bacteroides sp.]|jgi:hypothetical protein|nr:DUF3868 domain-containing protein [Bacteroides sp.]
MEFEKMKYEEWHTSKMFVNKIFLVFVWLLLSHVMSGQPAYQGKLYITNKNLSVSRGTLDITLTVSYERLNLPSNESLTITPVLKGEGQVLELPSVQINGTFEQRIYRREQALSSGSSIHPSLMILKDDPAKSRLFSYKYQVKYAAWMKNGMLFLRTGECGCNGKPAGIFEDKIADGVTLPLIRTSPIGADVDHFYLNMVNIVPVTDKGDTLDFIRGVIPYGLGKSEEKVANEIYFHLKQVVRSLEEQSGANITNLKITGYGTPEGNYLKNEKNASLRALALKNYLRDAYLVNNAPIEVKWVAEDWDSIRALVMQSEMPLKQAVTDIITTIDVNRGREHMLADLADGASYKYLWDHIFPRVRRVEYSIGYIRKYRLNAMEGRRSFELDSRVLKLSDFFALGMSYPKGSNEYNDVFDLAARLFPDSPEAAINAASVALSKCDAPKARAYLAKYATLPLAYNNTGVLYLLEGNRDKAEVYLQMAAANGVEEAKRTLAYLHGK